MGPRCLQAGGLHAGGAPLWCVGAARRVARLARRDVPAAGAVAQLLHSLLLRCHCWRCSPRSCVHLPAPTWPAPTSRPTGMLIALIAHRAATGQSSECSWYFVAFTFGGCSHWQWCGLHLRGRCCTAGCVTQWRTAHAFGAGAVLVVPCGCCSKLPPLASHLPHRHHAGPAADHRPAQGGAAWRCLVWPACGRAAGK